MDREGAPFVDGRRDRDGSAASLHQAEDQGEADAAAFERARGALYAMETLEDGFEVVFASADAGVGDGDAGARGVERDRDLDVPDSVYLRAFLNEGESQCLAE